MTTRYTRALWRCAMALAALLIVSWTTPAMAQNVQLNPATVQGTVTLTGQTFSSLYVSAYWTDNSTSPPTNYSASTTSSSSGSYSLIVNVPQGSTPTYNVSVYGYLNGTGQAYYFGSQTVNPDPTTPQTLNFSENPGVVQGTVAVSGGTLNYFYVYAGSDGSYFPGTSNTYSLVVSPGTQIYTYGYGYGQYGYANFSPSYRYIDVAAGQTVTDVNWSITVPPPPTTGEIDGTLVLSGSVTPTYLSVSAGGGNPYNSASATPDANGNFSLPGLNAGSYTVYASASFGNGNTYLSFPDSLFSPSRYPTVSANSTSNVAIAGTESFINGTLTIGGTTTLADTYYSQFSLSGVYQTNSYDGSAGVSGLPANGAFSLVVTDGSWAPSGLSLYYSKTSDPANYLYEYLYFFDYNQYYNPVAVSGGQTVTKNLTYATGNITVNFQALGNATFSYPNLSFNCSRTDPSTNQTIWTYSGNAYNYSLSNVTQGGVTFTGMAGDCTIQAAAYANGSNYVTFGTATATVVPGTIQVVDIGGPSVAVNFPDANYLTTFPNITVTGTANDQAVDIAGIDVNGVAATFSSTANALQPHEVAFSATIPLTLGANSVKTTVTAMDTDTAGKQASDTRTVYYDPGPLALAFTPPDGTISANADITIAGAATDPAGIQSILVNGQPVAFGSDGSFSLPFTLSTGDNFITVVASGVDADDAHPGQTISQTHKVTLASQSNPVVSATGGSFMYTGSPHAGSGSATGGMSKSLPVTITYTGTGSTSYGPSALPPVNAGTYQVVAHTDGDANTFSGDSAPASLTIAKADAAVVVRGYSVTYDGNAHTASGSATGVTGEALGGLALSGTTHTGAGAYNGDSWTFTDSTGNYNNASGKVNDSIGKANATISVTGYSVIYDGASHTATGSAAGVKGESLAGLNLSGTTHTAAGTYNGDAWTFTDVTGNYNNAGGTVNDSIRYNLCLLYDPHGVHQAGSTIPIKVQLCDASNVNASSASVILHATGIQLVSGTTNGTLQDSGNANPDNDFRVVGPPASYMFNLQTKGYAAGTYNLLFTVGSDPTAYGVSFQVR